MTRCFTRYFGFAIADGMFPPECEVSRRPLTVDEVKDLVVTGVVSCCNPSHTPTIQAMRSRFGLDIAVPEKAPVVTLKRGDEVVVMSVRGLPRMEGRHEYTSEEVEKANFAFGLWKVK
jgi:hypothetical protein